MRSVFEREEIGGSKHLFLNAGASRDFLAVFRVANFPTARAELVSQFITFPPIFCKPRLRARFGERRNLLRHVFFSIGNGEHGIDALPSSQPAARLISIQFMSI